jgi:hypothetical protein
MGAPTVLIEKLVNGRECLSAIKSLEDMLKVLLDFLLNEFFRISQYRFEKNCFWIQNNIML